MTTLRDLEAAAMPGPWEEDGPDIFADGHRLLVEAHFYADAAFIAAFRNVARELLDVVDAAREFERAVTEAEPGYAEGTPGLMPYDDDGERLARALAALDAKAPK